MNQNLNESIMTLSKQFLLTALFTLSLNAANVSGKWSGSLEFKDPEGHAQTIPAHAEFKQQDQIVTGAVWKEAGHEFRIENGKVEGDRITFEFKAPEGEEDSVLVHTVTLAVTGEGQLQGEVAIEAEGNRMIGKLVLTREH